ncbi:MAG: paraquat-inducible protein [Gammaproteobacteria bacterium]|jgi:paraquat-inducible protein A|nr:paraquat-inducible protein [Gammaproteobacteria bacterium]
MTAYVMGRSVGLLVCSHCRETVRAIRAARVRCPRCGALIHERRPHSVATTTALVLSAAALYVPANLLPVMHMHTFFGDEEDTIMSGVLSLIQDGSWPLALLVFVASIVVPMLKLLAMGWLLFCIARKTPGHPLQRSRLFRLVEFIGRWSMLDVYAIALLVALVQIRSLAIIHAGLGALAFCAVVVFTMLAAQSFDERLLWDTHSDG